MIIEIDLNSKIPIYEQIVDKIIILIAKGYLKAGDKLPSVRNLADICGINPMTANKSYKILEEKGFIQINRRSGAVVAEKNQVQEDDLNSLKLNILKLFASGMEIDEIRKIVDDCLEGLCCSD